MSARILTKSGSFKALTYLTLFGLATTVPLLVLSGALLLQSASVQRAQLQDRVLQLLDDLVNALDRDLDRDITILHTLATSQSLASADWRRFYDEAKAGLQGRAYLVLVDSNGRQLVNTYVPYGQQPKFTGDPETLRRILQTKAPVVSNLFTSLVVKKPVFNVSIPILRDGEVRYVMSLGLLPDDLLALLKSQNLGAEWVTLIWDAKGVVLARSRDNPRHVGARLPQNMREHEQRAVVRTTNLDGADVLHATARSQLSGWGVGVNAPYSLVTGPMRNSLLLWGAAGLFAIAIALIAGAFFARQITTSLSAAASAAAAFGRGDPFPLNASGLREADAFLVTLRSAQQAREKLMDEVKRSRDWLRTTLASIGDAVISTDHKGRITFLNAVAETLTGWTQEEALGKPLEQVFVIRDAETGGEVENPVAKALREGRIVGVARHTRLLAKDGRKTPIDHSAAPIHDRGDIVGVVLVFRDVTERLRAEELMRVAVEAAPNAMIMVGRDGRIALINSQTEKLFGYGRDQLLGQSIDRLVPERYRAGHEAFRASFFRDLVARPMGAGRDLFGLRKDGTDVPIEIGLTPISTSQGDFVLAAIIDISERKQAEEALRAALARAQKGEILLNAIMDYVPEGIAYAEAPDVTIRMVSRYGRDLTGKPRELIEGIPVEAHASNWGIYHLDGTPARNEELPLTRAVKSGELVLDEDWIMRDSAGREIFVLCNAAPVRDAQGNILGGIITWRDISERKWAERELRGSNQALQRANEDLNHFAFAASHDLQEPLRMITSYSQLLLKSYRGQLAGEAATCVEFITAGTERMRELLRDLLAYTQVANDRQPASDPVDLNRVFQTVLENCKAAIQEAQAVVTSDGLPTVEGQEAHFIQLLQNLIANGVKYREPGRTPTVHVAAERQDGLWRIAVKDNGMGIAPRYHQQIFGVFKRLHGKSIPGTGIGLAICQRVVERYGGKIWVDSHEGEGATFYFTIPAAQAGAASA